MSRSNLEYIRHMLDEIDYIERAGKGIDREVFLRDETLRRSFVRSIEIVGESAKKVSEDFRGQHSEIEWRKIAGMRDRLIHDYFGVDYGLVWDVVETNLPKLKRQLIAICS